MLEKMMRKRYLYTKKVREGAHKIIVLVVPVWMA
jgi:hypothetical protein